MNDQRLNELFGSLPRHEASPHFTREVIEKLGEKPKAPLRWIASAAVAATLMLVASTVLLQQTARDERVDIVIEREQLRRELDELRAISSSAETFVRVGDNTQFEYVVDLRQIVREEVDPRAILLLSDRRTDATY